MIVERRGQWREADSATMPPLSADAIMQIPVSASNTAGPSVPRVCATADPTHPTDLAMACAPRVQLVDEAPGDWSSCLKALHGVRRCLTYTTGIALHTAAVVALGFPLGPLVWWLSPWRSAR